MMSKQWCREHKLFYAIMFSFWKFESRFYLWNQRQHIYHDIPFDFIGLPTVNKIQLLIGDHGFYSNEDIGTVFDITVKKHWGNLVHIIYRRPVHIKFLWTLSPSVVMRVLWNKLLYFKCVYMCKDYFYATLSQTSHVHFAMSSRRHSSSTLYHEI